MNVPHSFQDNTFQTHFLVRHIMFRTFKKCIAITRDILLWSSLIRTAWLVRSAVFTKLSDLYHHTFFIQQGWVTSQPIKALLFVPSSLSMRKEKNYWVLANLLQQCTSAFNVHSSILFMFWCGLFVSLQCWKKDWTICLSAFKSDKTMMLYLTLNNIKSPLYTFITTSINK